MNRLTNSNIEKESETSSTWTVIKILSIEKVYSIRKTD